MDQSRLGRSLDEVPYALKRITDAGVRVWCYLTGQEVKRDTVVDRFQSNVMAFVDEMHREQARERTRDAMRRKAERGHVAGGMTYGYKNVRVDGHVEREIVPSEAETIRRIFIEVADGAGYVKIAKKLNAEGVPSPTRHGWAGSGVRELLFRPSYRGVQVYGKTRWEDRGGRRVKVRVPESDWITVEAPALRIVDDALWRRAHARLDMSRAAYCLKIRRRPGRPRAGTSESPYLLTSFLKCASCGSNLQVSHQPSRGTRLTYYVCATHRWRGASRCKEGVRVRMEPIESAVLARLERVVLAEDIVEDVIDAAMRRLAETRSSGRALRAKIERELHSTQRSVDHYVRAIGAGVDLAEVRKALDAATQRRDALQAELARAAEEMEPPAIDRRELRARLAQWRERLRAAPEVARKLLRALLPEPLVVERTPEGVRYRGRAAFDPLLSGLLPMGHVSALVPPG